MATASTSVITATAIGTGTSETSTAQRSLDMAVTQLTRKETILYSEALKRNKAINSTLTQWTRDVYRKPSSQALVRGAGVQAADGQSRTIGTVGNRTQIFGFTVSVDGTTQAIEAAGGNQATYSKEKQLVEMLTSIEAQMLDETQIGTQYAGQTGTAISTGNFSTSGSRMGSASSYALTRSFNPTVGTSAQGLIVATNNVNTDVTTDVTLTNAQYVKDFITGDGLAFWKSTGRTNQQFAPSTYKQLITAAKARYAARFNLCLTATQNRTHLSDTITTSRAINRVDSKAGDNVESYTTDFGVINLDESHIMGQIGTTNSVYFINTEAIGARTLRPIKMVPVTANADAVVEAWNTELTMYYQGEGIAILHDISPSGVAVATGATRPDAAVGRQATWNGQSY